MWLGPGRGALGSGEGEGAAVVVLAAHALAVPEHVLGVPVRLHSRAVNEVSRKISLYLEMFENGIGTLVRNQSIWVIKILSIDCNNMILP